MISRYMTKYACESLKRIDIKFLKNEGYLIKNTSRHGMIVWSSHGEETGRADIYVDTLNHTLNISYYYRDLWTERTYVSSDILITSTPCYFGGQRYWLKCECGKRVGILYAGGIKFRCRHCYDLVYYSQQEYTPKMFAALGRAWKKEEKFKEEYSKIRVKFWKGKPTKRYRRWLEKLSQYEESEPVVLQQLEEVIRCLGAIE